MARRPPFSFFSLALQVWQPFRILPTSSFSELSQVHLLEQERVREQEPHWE